MKVLVLKDKEGILRPVAFIQIDNEAGWINANNYKLRNGESIVVAELTEVSK